MEKARLDDRLVQEGMASDRQEAVALILSGRVLVDEQVADKPGRLLGSEVAIRVKSKKSAYASRGGLKLEAALRDLHISVRDQVCLDIGASTGGFTDCLLQSGACRVHALDVGRGQLDWRLRTDPRVVVHDMVNARFLTPAMISEPVHRVTVDLAFISLRLILPGLRAFKPASILALVKPQFEAQREEVGKGGVIRDPELRLAILQRLSQFALDSGFRLLGQVPSAIRGQEGNQEYFLFLENPL